MLTSVWSLLYSHPQEFLCHISQPSLSLLADQSTAPAIPWCPSQCLSHCVHHHAVVEDRGM